MHKLFKNNKKIFSFFEIFFLNPIKYVDKLIDIHNIKYLSLKDQKTKILNNIEGYELDKYQKEIVLSEEQNNLVIAGAGSGKTMTIIAKIIYLIKEYHYKENEILCISFTNETTNNLKNKLLNNYNLSLDIYTFHKLSLTILESNNEKYNIAPDNYLNYIVDDFLLNEIPNNKLLLNSLNLLLKNNVSIPILKKTIITFINLFKGNNYNLKDYLNIIKKNKKYNYNYKTNKALFHLIINIYLYYQNELSKETLLDFNDMINKAITSLKEKGLRKNWKYLIIDEFQDTSLTKFNLLKEIINLTNAKLLAVGDDYQSIYRFTGCNLDIFLNFSKLLPYTKKYYLVNTYRNSKDLINAAKWFIMKNKKQLSKTLLSSKSFSKPIKIIYSVNKISTFKNLLNVLKKEEILVLGRNNKDIYNYIDNDFSHIDNFFEYNKIKFKYLTVHRAKGLESSKVIILNLDNRINGFPSKMKTEPILDYLNKIDDYYPYEEERRLFYVALTRTKNEVYLLCDKNNPSIFINEIKKYKKAVEIIRNIN